MKSFLQHLIEGPSQDSGPATGPILDIPEPGPPRPPVEDTELDTTGRRMLRDRNPMSDPSDPVKPRPSLVRRGLGADDFDADDFDVIPVPSPSGGIIPFLLPKKKN
tara:strand:- start:102 stop:419 length:318 start_codon:yes stop_codon:yes gene_type:complete